MRIQNIFPKFCTPNSHCRVGRKTPPNSLLSQTIIQEQNIIVNVWWCHSNYVVDCILETLVLLLYCRIEDYWNFAHSICIFLIITDFYYVLILHRWSLRQCRNSGMPIMEKKNTLVRWFMELLVWMWHFLFLFVTFACLCFFIAVSIFSLLSFQKIVPSLSLINKYLTYQDVTSQSNPTFRLES